MRCETGKMEEVCQCNNCENSQVISIIRYNYIDYVFVTGDLISSLSQYL